MFCCYCSAVNSSIQPDLQWITKNWEYHLDNKLHSFCIQWCFHFILLFWKKKKKNYQWDKKSLYTPNNSLYDLPNPFSTPCSDSSIQPASDCTWNSSFFKFLIQYPSLVWLLQMLNNSSYSNQHKENHSHIKSVFLFNHLQ